MPMWLHLPKAHASESSTYDFGWLDPDKEVYVLQNRKFRKKSKLNVSLGGGFTTSGAFVDSKTIQVRAGYFFLEEWGFEILYGKLSGDENSTATSVRNEGAAGSVPFRRITQDYLGAMAIWSPFYSKVNTFNTIIYYDWVIGLGAAKITEENNKDEFLNGPSGSKNTQESHTGLMWGTGLKVYLNQYWDVRFDVTGIHYKAQKPSRISTEDTFNEHYDLTLAVGLRF